jgi:hypothetical protein
LARKLEEHADEVVNAYLAGIRSDEPNRAYRAADAWISRVHGQPKEPGPRNSQALSHEALEPDGIEPRQFVRKDAKLIRLSDVGIGTR